MSGVNDLKKEVDRLTFDLQQACQEKVQAAGYGLAVLEEKQELQDKYDDLQKQLDNTKGELDRAKEVSFIKKYILYSIYTFLSKTFSVSFFFG